MKTISQSTSSCSSGFAATAFIVVDGKLKAKSEDTSLWHELILRTVEGNTFLVADQTGTVNP